MDFNSAVQDWARSRPSQQGNEFTGFIKGHKVLDHMGDQQILQGVSDDGANLRNLLFLSTMLHYPGGFINLPCHWNHYIIGITELHLKM